MWRTSRPAFGLPGEAHSAAQVALDGLELAQDLLRIPVATGCRGPSPLLVKVDRRQVVVWKHSRMTHSARQYVQAVRKIVKACAQTHRGCSCSPRSGQTERTTGGCPVASGRSPCRAGRSPPRAAPTARSPAARRRPSPCTSTRGPGAAGRTRGSPASPTRSPSRAPLQEVRKPKLNWRNSLVRRTGLQQSGAKRKSVK